MKVSFTILLIGVLLSVAAAVAPLHGVGLDDTIPDEYIVVLNEELSIEMRDDHVSDLLAVHPSVVVKHKYAIGSLIAFSVKMDKGALARELEHEDVKYIEANQVVRINADDTITQANPDWGLDRVSHKDLPLDQKYQYYESAGTGVDAYVVDTGIKLDHTEFKDGRAHWGDNFADTINDDCQGHGTHVAGTIGGLIYGMAKNVKLIAVKVLDCGGSGSYEGVIAGINWVADRHKESKTKRSVANLSLGGGASPTVDAAVNQAVAAGVNMVIAAGNNNLNACNYSPARAANAFTVGATASAASSDPRSSFSNYGNCVKIFAPGTNIKSAWIDSTTATNTISGTSMAAPHVAGAVACHLGHLLALNSNEEPPTPAAVITYFQENAAQNKVTNPGTGSPNKLLYSPSSSL